MMAARIPDPMPAPPSKTLSGVVVPLVLITDDWPDAKIVQLRLLFDAGLTHALIAGTMEISKGAVSAKIGRLGWTRIENRPPPPKRIKPLIDARKAVRIEALGADDCRWPLTVDRHGVQLFCGAHRTTGGSYYCAGHEARAHRKPWQWEEAITDLPEPPPYAFEGDDE